jgi:hypothetical protein
VFLRGFAEGDAAAVGPGIELGLEAGVTEAGEEPDHQVEVHAADQLGALLGQSGELERLPLEQLDVHFIFGLKIGDLTADGREVVEGFGGSVDKVRWTAAGEREDGGAVSLAGSSRSPAPRNVPFPPLPWSGESACGTTPASQSDATSAVDLFTIGSRGRASPWSRRGPVKQRS